MNNLNPLQALLRLLGRPVCTARTLYSLQGVLLLPFFLLLSLPHQTHPQGRYHSIQVNLHIYYNQFWMHFFHHSFWDLNLAFNKFDSIFRTGFHTLLAFYAIFRASYNCLFYLINLFNIKNFCRANFIAGKSPGTLVIIDYWIHFPLFRFP